MLDEGMHKIAEKWNNKLIYKNTIFKIILDIPQKISELDEMNPIFDMLKPT